MGSATASSLATGPSQVYTVSVASTDVEIDLTEPRSRFLVRVEGGIAGRAEARFGEQRWAAKHYWQEGGPGAEVTVYEFDEEVPAGRFVLHVPVAAGSLGET